MDDGSFTRGALTHAYYPAPVTTTRMPGAVKVTMRPTNQNSWQQGIPQVWPIARPVTAPAANGAPFYVNGDVVNKLIRGGMFSFSPLKPNREMDPSDPNTWQRDYRFT